MIQFDESVRIPFGGLFGTVPELLFEKKELIPKLQDLLVSYSERIT